MTSKVEGGWTGIRRRAANSALALAMLMLPSMFATRVVQAQTFTLLYSFKPDGKDSGFPLGGLIGDRAGNLYGTTAGNGAFGSGTVFKLDPTGTETVLHNFAGTSDGGNPYCTLIRDTAGNFHGTASTGGLSNLGTVFKLDVTGNESVLHSFTGGTDGAYPFAGLLRDVAGNLYGTTYRGGGFNQGTVFKLDANGQETVLYSFRGTPDGGLPWASLLLGPTGNLYGTTQTGGAYNLVTVFKVDPAGNETVLHSFGSGLDGVYPQAGLIRDVSGNLYGTTARGGSRGVGTIFKLD